jgi:hypothetical protein
MMTNKIKQRCEVYKRWLANHNWLDDINSPNRLSLHSKFIKGDIVRLSKTKIKHFMLSDPKILSKEYLSRLNGTAQLKASRISEGGQYATMSAHSLLMEPLPIMAQSLVFEQRVELFFYLRLLEKEEGDISKATQGEWRDKKLTYISDKIKEINQHLEWVDMGWAENKDAIAKSQAGKIGHIGEKPWLITDPKDPPPKYPWYTPARYFARQEVIADPTLISKRKLLANKVANALYAVNFKNRSKNKFDPGTILKAFTKVTLG